MLNHVFVKLVLIQNSYGAKRALTLESFGWMFETSMFCSASATFDKANDVVFSTFGAAESAAANWTHIVGHCLGEH